MPVYCIVHFLILSSLISPGQCEYGWSGIQGNTGQVSATAWHVSVKFPAHIQLNPLVSSAAASSLDLNQETRRLFIGQDNGTISVWTLWIIKQIHHKHFDFRNSNYQKILTVCRTLEITLVSKQLICLIFIIDSHNSLAHQGRVTALLFALYNEWVLSCGRDKYFQWHCSETGRRLGGYQTAAWCTCLSYPFLHSWLCSRIWLSSVILSCTSLREKGMTPVPLLPEDSKPQNESWFSLLL